MQLTDQLTLIEGLLAWCIVQLKMLYVDVVQKMKRIIHKVHFYILNIFNLKQLLHFFYLTNMSANNY